METHCGECGWQHEPDDAHNLGSAVYRKLFHGKHGRWPTWEDAFAHCEPEVKDAWRKELGVVLISDPFPERAMGEADFLYRYKATVLRVVDGDTFDAEVQMGFGMTVRPSGKFDLGRFRVYGIDTPETLHRKSGLTDAQWDLEKAAGQKSKARMIELIAAKTVYLRTEKPDKYGRWLAWVWVKPEDYGVVEKSVNFILLNEGFAKVYENEPLPKTIGGV